MAPGKIKWHFKNIKIFNYNFSGEYAKHFHRKFIEEFLGILLMMVQWCSGNGLRLPGNKPLPEPISLIPYWWLIARLWLSQSHQDIITRPHWVNSLAPGKFEWHFRRNFQTDFSDRWLRHLLLNCPHMDVNGLHWRSVNIGSGNGLVPSGSKPLPESMLTPIYVAKWRH